MIGHKIFHSKIFDNLYLTTTVSHQVKQEEEIIALRLHQTLGAVVVELFETVDDASDPPQLGQLDAPDDGYEAGEDVTAQQEDEGPEYGDVEIKPLLPTLHLRESILIISAERNLTETNDILGLETPENIDNYEEDAEEHLHDVLDDVHLVEQT